MFKKTSLFIAAGLLAVAPVHADLFEPEDAVKYRQALYQTFSSQMSVMGAMLQGNIEFDAAEINRRATNMANTAVMMGDTYFPATRGVETSNMRDRAWENMSDFQAKGAAFGEALTALVEQSSQSDFSLRDARSAVGAVQRSCRSCHDDYRAR